jgi:TetR/AcrR family transcriptional repressor of nem operon
MMKDLKQKLLDVGFDLISEQGFAGIGVMKIITAADATKGSFYHHFKSKEDFGCILLDNYFEEHLTTLDKFLTTASLNPQERVFAYFQHWSVTKITDDFHIKCLIVKLSGEISGTSNQMQEVLKSGSEKMIMRMSSFFEEGISQGDFSMTNSYEISRAIYSLWLGSTLLCALQKDQTILSNAMRETGKLIALVDA